MKKYFLIVSLILVSLITFSLSSDDFVVATKFSGPNEEGYWGPYGPAFTLKDNVLIFDSSIPNAWMTLNFKDDFMEPEDYRYVVITMRADDPEDAQNILMTFGDIKKPIKDWKIKLKTEFTTYILDLFEFGLTKWGDGTKAEPDFALNKATAKKAKLFVQSIILTNDKEAFE
ncbi:MAG: hypothetical protein N2516_02580 [Dictyoglomaceae bacterium]|nr:hypothetical protein [Dictyoglomaceae bacterium]